MLWLLSFPIQIIIEERKFYIVEIIIGCTFPEIEMVIANNDDMALGAMDALDECDYPLDPFVVGINGTPDALEAISTAF